jgi:hypothetical protein
MSERKVFTDSGRLIVLRTEHVVAKPIVHNAAAFVKCLHQSWKRCKELEHEGVSKETIGHIFFKSFNELFERTPKSVKEYTKQS